MQHSESVELGRAQAISLIRDRLNRAVLDYYDFRANLFDEVGALVDALNKYVPDYPSDNPSFREEIEAGAKELGEKL
jgi:hypothetical protein